MKPYLNEHDIILIMQGLNAIWWDNDDMKRVERLEAKLKKVAKSDPRLSAFLEKNWPTMQTAD